MVRLVGRRARPRVSMRLTRRQLAAGVVAVILGIVAGLISSAFGPVGWTIGALMTILVAISLRGRSVAFGVYLILVGAVGLLILLPDVIGHQACPSSGLFGAVTGSGSCEGPQGCTSTCYSPLDIPALVIYALAGAAGLGIGLLGLLRSLRAGATPT